MPDPTITNNDLGSVVLRDAQINDDTFTAAGAGTILEGTILARDSVSGKLVVFEKGGTTNENGIPKAVLTHELVAAGAGDLPVRAMVAGQVRLEKLVIDADGDASNVDAVVRDQLRDYGGIVSISVNELAELDNQ